MSTEAENQPKVTTDLSETDLSNNAMRKQFHGPEKAKRHNLPEQQNKEGWSNKQKAIAAAAFFGVIGVGAVAEQTIANSLRPTVSNPSEEGQPNTTEPSVFESAQPSPSSTEVMNTLPATVNPEQYINVKETPKSVIESGLFETLTPEQQEEVKKYEAMPLAEFRKLPLTEQLKYAQYIYDNNAIRTKYNLSHINDTGKQLVDRLTPASPESTAQQVLDQSNFNDSLSMDLIYDGGSATPYLLDKDSAKKIQVLTIQHGSESEKRGDTYIDAARIAGGIEVGDGMTTHQSKVIESDDRVQMIINVDADKKNSAVQDVYSLARFKDINGKDRVTWQIQAVYAMDDPRAIDIK